LCGKSDREKKTRDKKEGHDTNKGRNERKTSTMVWKGSQYVRGYQPELYEAPLYLDRASQGACKGTLVEVLFNRNNAIVGYESTKISHQTTQENIHLTNVFWRREFLLEPKEMLTCQSSMAK
jgi:hypothetical protein